MNIMGKNYRAMLLLLAGSLALSGCSNDVKTRSLSYAKQEINVPLLNATGDKTVDGYRVYLTGTSPSSTIPMNIDNNSYGNLRRAIGHGEIPSAVRLAEWLNYFEYGYPKAQKNRQLSAVTEIAPTPWNRSSRLLLIGVSAVPQLEAPANNIVVLIDVSEGKDDSAVVSLVKKTLTVLKDRLRPQDKIAFVTFSSTPSIALSSTAGDEKSAIKSGIGHVEFGTPSTPSGAVASLNLAYSVLENGLIKGGNNSLILITDGDLGTNPNGVQALEKTVARKRNSGITLSTLVFNVNRYNYQAMQRLADLGGGVHAYVDTLNEAEKVIAQQLAYGNRTVAQPVELQVNFDPKYIYSYRLLGYEKNNVKTMVQDKSNAHALRAGQTVTALYEIQPIDANIAPEEPHKYYDLGRISVKYQLPNQRFTNTLDLSIIPAQIKTGDVKVSKDFSFASALAAFALHLKRDVSVKDYPLENIIRLAENGVDNDELGLRAEFVRLLKSVADIQGAGL